MADELVPRTAKAGDWKNIEEMFAAAGSQNGKDYWKWKFMEHPWKERSPLAVVTEADGQLVSFMAALPMRFETPGGALKGSQIVDSMTLPEYRRRGMFRTGEGVLAQQMAKKKHGLSVGFAKQDEPAIQGFFNMGYSYVCSLAPALKVYDSKAYSGSAANPMKRVMRGALALRAKAQQREMPSDVTMEKQAPKDMDKFLKDNHSKEPFHVARTKEFLDWRVKNPNAEHGFIVKWMDSDICGYMLYSIHQREGMKQGYILDAIAKDEDAYSDMFAGLYGMAKENELAVVRSQTIDGSPLHRTLLANGFAKHLAKTAFVVKDIGCNKDECKQETKWHITLADADHA